MGRVLPIAPGFLMLVLVVVMLLAHCWHRSICHFLTRCLWLQLEHTLGRQESKRTRVCVWGELQSEQV